MDELDTVAVKAEVRTLLEGFDKHIFVRNTDHDHEPGWAIQLLPYLAALANLQRWACP